MLRGAWLNRRLKKQVLGAWSKSRLNAGWRSRLNRRSETQVLGAWCLVKKQVTTDQGLRTSRSEIADEAADLAVCFGGLSVDELKLLVRDVVLVKGRVELTFYLGAGTLGVSKEPKKSASLPPSNPSAMLFGKGVRNQ